MADKPTTEFLQSPARSILMVITSLGLGGADTQVVDIARLLRARGWSVAIVSMVPPAAHQDTLAACGIPVHSLEMRRRIPDPRAIARLCRLISRWKPDVVHSHMVHANLLARVTRFLVRVPALVCTAHNTRESSERGGPTWHKELLYRLTDRLADQTTIVCEAGFEHYVRQKAAPAERLKVVPLGIDCTRFAPDPASRAYHREQLRLPDNRFTFLAVGRMVVQKDYPNLLRAAASLRHKSWTVLIAGSGPLRAELEALSGELGLEEHVQFLGVRQDIRAWYHAADAFVMASAVEGMPVVLLEAAASGLPAVVTDAGGNAEFVVSGKTGFVVPKQNSLALARAMDQMLQLPPARRAQFSADARARALQHFEIEGVVSQWEGIYENCLRKRARVPPLQTFPRLAPTRAPRVNG